MCGSTPTLQMFAYCRKTHVGLFTYDWKGTM